MTWWVALSGGLVLLLLISALTGTNPADLIDTAGPTSDTVAPGAVASDDPQVQFVSVVLKDTEATWERIFASSGASYEQPVLVLFTDATRSACGLGQAAMGPFYCPADHKVYLDLSFFRELDQQFGARPQTVVLEQRLLFEDVEVEILRERVDQVFVRQRRGGSGIGAYPFDRRCQQRFELGSLLSDGVAVRGPERRFRQRLHLGASIAAAVILPEDPETL